MNRVEFLKARHMEAFEHEFAFHDIGPDDDPMSFGSRIVQTNTSDEDAKARQDALRMAEASFFDRLVDTDPTPRKTYLAWLLQVRRRNWVIEIASDERLVFPQDRFDAGIMQVKGRTIPHEALMGRPLIGEDLQRVYDLIAVFDANKHRLPVEQRDIMRCHGEIELHLVVENFLVSEQELGSNEEKRRVRDRAYAEAVVHFDESGWMLIEPLTQDASKFFGRGTRWCTAANLDNAFENYASNGGRLFISIDPNGLKHQFHLPSGDLRAPTDAGANPDLAFAEAPLQFQFKLAELVTPAVKDRLRRSMGSRTYYDQHAIMALASLVPGEFGARFRKSLFASMMTELLADALAPVVSADGWSIHRLKKSFAFDYFSGELNKFGGPSLDDLWGWPGGFGEASFLLQEPNGTRYLFSLESICQPPTYGNSRTQQMYETREELPGIAAAFERAPRALQEWVSEGLLPPDPIDPLQRLHIARITSPMRQHIPAGLVPAWLMQVWGGMAPFHFFREYRQDDDVDMQVLTEGHFEPMQVVHKRGSIEVLFADDTVELVSGELRFLNEPAFEREDGLPVLIVEEAIGIRRGVIDKAVVRSAFAHLDVPAPSISPTPSGNVA